MTISKSAANLLHLLRAVLMRPPSKTGPGDDPNIYPPQSVWREPRRKSMRPG